MARGIDVSSLTRAERAVLLTGALLFFNGMIPWWYRVGTPDGTFTYNAGLNGWGIVACVAGAVASIAVLARASIWPDPAPTADGTVYLALGVVALTALIAQMLDARAEWLGLYAEIALAAALTAAGAKRRSERRRGWT